jgi:glyoxylase-like metal-dependent hydrolase (beta-lactamase superfamily II)
MSIGVKKIYLLDYGVLSGEMGWFIPDPSVISERGFPKAAEWVDIPVTGALIEHKDGIILMDTGSHPEAEKIWPRGSWNVFPMTKLTEENHLEHQLKLAGYKLEDIHFVVFTHLHLDHAGQAYKLRDHNPLYVMHEREIKHALYMMWLGKTGAYVPQDIESLRGANIFAFPDEHLELLPGVELYRFGGHTPGSIVLKVTTDNGNTYVFTGDFLHLPKELDVESKGWLLGNYEEFLRGVKLLKLWSRRPNVKLVISHDPDLWKKYPKAPKHLD